MRLLGLTAVLGLSLGVAVPWADGQTLGEAAAKERERRAKAGATRTAVPNYTDDDLEEQRKAAGVSAKASPAAGTESPPPTAGATGQTTRRSETTEPRDDTESALVAAVDSLAGLVKAGETQVESLRALLNPMSSTYIYGPSGSGDPNEELQVRARIQTGEEALARLKAQLDSAKRELEAHRSGHPGSTSGARDY